MPRDMKLRMRLLAASFPVLLALVSPTALAESELETEPPENNFDDDLLDADEPIYSPVYGPRLTFTSPNGGVTVLYGQFNLAYQSLDDGEDTTSKIVDNGNWNSRFGVTYTLPVGENTFRARFETGLTRRNSSLISQTNTPAWDDWRRPLLRWFEVAVDSKYGVFSLGQGATASNGSAGLDDSFTFIAGATDSTDGFASFRFRDRSGALTPVSIGQVNSSLDALRRFRVRYETPDFSGVTLSTSVGKNVLNDADNNGYYDAAARWTGTLGNISVRSALGYQWIDISRADTVQRLAGSVSLLHEPTGLNFALSAGDEKDGPDYYWLRGGWRTRAFEAGTTSLSVDYYNGSNFLSRGARTENYGVYAVQDIDDWSVNLYIGWRQFTYSDRLGNSYQDADGLLTGVRFHF